MDEAFDPLRILAGLRAHGVLFVLVGGLATAARGSPIETDDVDICFPGDDDNLERLGLALRDLEAHPASGQSGDEHRVSFTTAAGRLDCLESASGFADLDAKASELDLGRGVVARVASVDDLERLKRASGDLAGATYVAALRSGAREPGVDGATASDREPTKRGRVDRIWKALEDVDSFLTDLNNRGLPRPWRKS